MAKNYSSKESNGSLIFIWILVILLAVGTFFVVKSYGDNHTDIMKNTEVVQLIADKTGKNLGDITKEDIAGIEVLSVSSQIDYMQLMQPDGTISISPDQTLPYVSYVTLGLKGFSEASDEEAENYVVSYVGDFSSIKDDFALFTGIKELELVDYAGLAPEFDFSTLSADAYKNIEALTVIGYNVKNFANVADHKNLKALSISEIGNEDFANVKNIAGLETLYVEGTALSDASAVEGLTALKNLTVTGTSIKNIPSLEKLVNLETVDFTNNALKDIAPLSALNAEKITKVSITGNEIEDFSPISHIAEDKIVKDTPEETTEETAEEATEAATEETTEVAE